MSLKKEGPGKMHCNLRLLQVYFKGGEGKERRSTLLGVCRVGGYICTLLLWRQTLPALYRGKNSSLDDQEKKREKAFIVSTTTTTRKRERKIRVKASVTFESPYGQDLAHSFVLSLPTHC